MNWCHPFSDAVYLISEQSCLYTNTVPLQTGCVIIQGLIHSAAAAFSRIWHCTDGQSVWSFKVRRQSSLTRHKV